MFLVIILLVCKHPDNLPLIPSSLSGILSQKRAKTGKTERLQAFIESEVKSCSFDPELITPEYVYRMWGRAVAIEDIATAMEDVRRRM